MCIAVQWEVSWWSPAHPHAHTLSMKFTTSLLLVTALAVFGDTAYAPSGRSNLNVGYVNTGDRLLYRGYLYRQGVPNSIQAQDLVYRGNSTTRISAVRATEVGYTQYANPWIIQGGVGYNSVTVRVQSARSAMDITTLSIFGDDKNFYANTKKNYLIIAFVIPSFYISN